MTPYPQSFPLECITLIVAMIRNREASARRAEFAHCVWELVGFGLKATLGDASHAFGAAGDVDDDKLRECVTALKDYQDDGEAFGADSADEGIDPATLMILINLAVTLIQKWLNRKES